MSGHCRHHSISLTGALRTKPSRHRACLDEMGHQKNCCTDSETLHHDDMVHQKRSKLDNCSQPISESDDINSESLPAKDDDYNCDSDDNSASHDMDVSQPHVNEISTNELLKTLKRKLSKSKRSEDDNIKMKRSESIELDNDVMINQVLRDIIQRDQIINSLKKKLNIHHNIGDQNLKDKNVDTDLKSDAFSRFSVKYFSKVDSLSPHHKTVIENSCFQSMLLFDKCFVPNSFALWIAKQVDVNCSDIVLGQKLIPLNKQFVHVVLGLPVGGSTIHSKFDSGKQKILQIFGKTSIPSVKFFGEKLIKNEELPDDQILICFMIVSLNCFLCPNSSLIPSTKYLSAFEDMDLIESLDWCKLVFDWLMEHISKIEKSKTFGGCLFHLAVNYLDFLNFGSQKVLLDTPRIKVWKRSMIKDYSKFDKISEGVYGKRPVNDIASTCYPMVNNSSSSFADMLKSSVGDLLPSDVQDKICHLLCYHFGKEDEIFEDKAKKLLIDVLLLLADCSSNYPTQPAAHENSGIEPDHEPVEENNDDVNQAVKKNNNFTSSPKGNSKTILDDDKLPIPNEEFNPVNKSTILNSSEEIKHINIDEIMTKLNKTGHVPINPPDETEKNSALTARNNQVFHDQPSFKIWDSDDDLHHENDDFKKEITPAHLVDSYQVIPDSYSPNPVLRNKITPRKLSQTFAAAVESPIICSDSPDKMYMVTLENSTSPNASLNENKENEKGCHIIKDDLLKHPSRTDFSSVRKCFDGASKARPIQSCEMTSNFALAWNSIMEEYQINFDAFKIVYPPVPRQNNLFDCGVFTLKYMELWGPRVQLTNHFSQKDIQNIRIQYVNRLFFHPDNSVLGTGTKKLVIDFAQGN
ncbi:Os08g0514300 [Oryza sativa Japonica Group]|uniref:Os08g0514300 protein n=1 Tax=Oryza sativa subsp. japonica TaxID=39947 RepID=Q0J4H1_ORYSJ|nr:Os08g0514300 [Oryza sativa Japonica Group]|eukprot:NP_001062230.1 Os08g0514300 [Oryza sativa Japonica Group]